VSDANKLRGMVPGRMAEALADVPDSPRTALALGMARVIEPFAWANLDRSRDFVANRDAWLVLDSINAAARVLLFLEGEGFVVSSREPG
jgi:hypothetical protein